MSVLQRADAGDPVVSAIVEELDRIDRRRAVLVEMLRKLTGRSMPEGTPHPATVAPRTRVRQGGQRPPARAVRPEPRASADVPTIKDAVVSVLQAAGGTMFAREITAGVSELRREAVRKKSLFMALARLLEAGSIVSEGPKGKQLYRMATPEERKKRGKEAA